MYLQQKNTIKHLSSALLAALFLLTSAAVFANYGGVVSAITGYATVTSPSGESKRLELGDKLENGDVVDTGNESSISITLASGEVVTLGSLASYTIVGEGKNDADGGKFASRSLGNNGPTLSTATSAGGGIAQDDDVPPVTPITPDPPVAPTPPAPTPPPPVTPTPGGSGSS